MIGRGIPPLALLLAGLGFVLLFRIGEPPPANPAEARVESVVREMVASGNWLVPRIEGQPRLHKPPGYYWVSAALSRLAGQTTRASVRVGSALAALVLVSVIFAWGRAIGGVSLGLVAALCLSSMLLMVKFGRRGVAEMLLAAFAALALASFDRIYFEQRWRRLPLFGLALICAILAKATVALLLIGLPIVVQLALDGSWRQESGRRVLAWMGLACIPGFLWYGVMLTTVPGAAQTFLSEALLPLGIQMQGGDSSALHYHLPIAYLSPLFIGTLPASLFLPLAIRRLVASRLYADSPRRRFIALVFLSLGVAFALIPQKQRHYLLPLLPLLALLLGEAIVDLHAHAPGHLRAVLRWLTGLLTPIGVGILMVLSCFYTEFLGMPAGQRVALQTGGTGLLGAMLWSAWRGRADVFAALSTLATLALMWTWFGSVSIWRDQLEAGTVASRPEYQADRWERASQAHPLIARFLLADRRGS